MTAYTRILTAHELCRYHHCEDCEYRVDDTNCNPYRMLGDAMRVISDMQRMIDHYKEGKHDTSES